MGKPDGTMGKPDDRVLAKAESASGPTWKKRGWAALPFLIPGLAGIAYLTLLGAPQSYGLINAGAMAAGLIWACIGCRASGPSIAVAMALGCIALFALPLLTGPVVEGNGRWLSLGGFTLHMGLTCIPLIAVLSAQDERFGPFLLLAATGVALLQPDAASTLALSGAAFGVAAANSDRRAAAIGALGLLATAAAILAPNPAPQAYVERVIPHMWGASPAMAILVSLSLVASVALILTTPHAPKAPRFALAGALSGLIFAALLADYPTPLVGYGAASILGLGLALPAIGKRGGA
ncbi:MAG: hypothetical protein AAGH57_10680 [Pseudomonadota bacterium]